MNGRHEQETTATDGEGKVKEVGERKREIERGKEREIESSR